MSAGAGTGNGPGSVVPVPWDDYWVGVGLLGVGLALLGLALLTWPDD